MPEGGAGFGPGSGGRSGSVGGSGGGPACVPSSNTESQCSDGVDDDCDGFPDCLDSECEGQPCGSGDGFTCLAGACLRAGALPSLPRIDNVRGIMRSDTAIVEFEPFAGARDYRIYPLPDDDDVLVGANGELAVRNAVYRCGGDLPRVLRDTDQVRRFASSLSGEVRGYTRRESDSLLGHVFLTPGPGRQAVYRVANPDLVGGYAWEYEVPPAKEYNGADYVVGTEARDRLLASGWRDDGIAFYAPENGTRPIYRRAYEEGGLVVFYTDGPERDARQSHDQSQFGERFRVLASAEPGSVPLYRIFYSYHHDHDTLAAGEANRDRVLHQGNQPVTSLSWSGLTESTTLVIEALDTGCPFPGGYIGASDAPSSELGGIANEPTITLDQARLSSGEVYVNGQHDRSNRPRPIARAYFTANPEPHPQMDWFESFDPDANWEPLEKIVEDNNGTRVFRNRKFSVEFMASTDNYSYGPLLGQLALGSTAPVYIAARGVDARIAADSFLHVRMASDIASTLRRYPQIWITTTPLAEPGSVRDGDVPIAARLGPLPSETLPPGNYHTIVAQTFGAYHELQVQFCDRRGWGVSQQCPKANLYGFHAGNTVETWDQPWNPVPVLGEVTGMDRLVQFDVYASTERVYIFVNERPGACADLPAGRMPEGPVTVVFGNAAYHIEIDEHVVPENSEHKYWQRYSLSHSQRRWDDLGIDVGAPRPSWDESVLPCGTRYYGNAL